jgi:SAM-dependent methyltransferase
MEEVKSMGADTEKFISCPLCSKQIAAGANIITKDRIYYHCQQCGLIFVDKEFLPDRTEERERYLQHNNSIAAEGYVAMLEQFIGKAILPFGEKGQEVLDFGCGPEPVLKILLERQGFVPDIYDLYFAPRLPGKENYDLITSTEVLEHIYTPQTVWHYFAQTLKPGGHLAVMTLFAPPLPQFSAWWYRQDFTHVCFYSKKTFVWLQRVFPFTVVFMDNKNTVVMRRI